MKPYRLILFFFAFIFVLKTAEALSVPDNSKVCLEELWGSRKYFPRSIASNVPMNCDEHFSVLEEGFKIVEYAYETGEKSRTIVDFEKIFEKASVKLARINSYTFNHDESKILIATQTEAIYRYSSKSYFFVYDKPTAQLIPLYEKGKQRLATFSPDGQKAAFVFDNNLYVKDLTTGHLEQVTNDGKYNEIINGTTDWVYEEEFGITQGFFWSPDSRKIAFYRFDEAHVKEFVMLMYGTLYPELYSFKYPKAGEENAHVSVHVYDLKTKKTIEVDTGTEKDQYIPRVKWLPADNKLAVCRMNRLQNHLEILLANTATGNTEVLYEEKSRYYIEIDDHLTFSDDGKKFFLTSEKDGYNHIYSYAIDGQPLKQITSGNWDVMDIVGFNSETETIYYLSTEVSPLTRHLYAVNINGQNKIKLSGKDGFYNPTFSKNLKYYICQFSDVETPPQYAVRKSHNGQKVRLIEDNKDLKQAVENLNTGALDFFVMTTADGTDLNGWMIKPPHFDSTEVYPVLFYVYGGPGVQTVRNRWGGHNYLWFRKLAQMGYIVVSVDNRGTPGRGEEFKKATYLQLGKYETKDMIETAQYIGNMSFVDNKRIGIFGWSYGGYLSLLCMTKGADYFKTGMAVAPVTNWRFYDTIYTERFMGLPKDNADGYDDNSPINHVDKLKGNLLIVHGSADDNVHYQNAMEIFDALVKANKPFDMHIYTNKNHGIFGGNARLHLYRKMTDYLLENL